MNNEHQADILFSILVEFSDRTYLDLSHPSGFICEANTEECTLCKFGDYCTPEVDIDIVNILITKYPELLV